MSYLSENLGNAPMNVYSNSTRKFMYYDDSRNLPGLNFPSTRKLNVMKFSEFLDCVKVAESGLTDESSSTSSSTSSSSTTKAIVPTSSELTLAKTHNIKPGDHLYLQQVLSSNVGPKIVQDFLHFNWKFLGDVQRDLKWRDLTTNLLLVGMAGVTTPAHYDEQENMFAQIRGIKRCLLFGPDQFKNLYPYPVHHPCDRQSQVDFDNPDLTKFPKFTQAHAWECLLEPGEVLYIPTYWWHHIESLTDTVSINFWYLAASTPNQIVYPLSAAQETAMMRNIEKMVGDALGNPLILHRFWHDMIDGRYFYPTVDEEEKQKQQPTYVHNAGEAQPSLQQIAQQLSSRWDFFFSPMEQQTFKSKTKQNDKMRKQNKMTKW